MHIVEYTDAYSAYSYGYSITPYKHKRTVYTIMRPHFKIVDMSHTPSNGRGCNISPRKRVVIFKGPLELNSLI
jgi:hypothetical protein